MQLREFTHHVGDQIGFGELCGLRGLFGQRVTAELLANGAGNGAHAFHAFALAAQLVVINHLTEPIHTGSQRFLTVLVKEKLGVGQARAHHALVAADDEAGVIGTDVADHQKLVRQLACRVQQREVFLVGLHREDQAFLRHVEEFLVKRTNQHVRALNQRGHLIEQGVVINRLAAATNLGRCGRQLAHDVSAALGKAGNHRAFVLQLLRVAVGMPQHHRVHQRFKPVAVRAVACCQPQRLNGHHIRAMQRHQAVGRAHKAHAGPAGQRAVCLQLVGHDLGDRQLGNGLQQGFLQAFGQRCAGHGAVIEQRFGFAVRYFFQPRHGRRVRAQRRELFEQRRGGVARSIQPHRHGHEFLRHRFVRGLRRDACDVCGQTSR